MSQEMIAKIFALASIRRIRYHVATTPLNCTKTKSDSKLLDFIALLLVTSDKDDVAAVAMEQHPNTVTFLFSKNAPCPSSFSDYLQRLLTICGSAEKKHFRTLFLTEVFKTCRAKIRNRLAKCQKAIRAVGEIELDEGVGDSIVSGESFAQSAADFFESLLKYDMAPQKEAVSRIRSK